MRKARLHGIDRAVDYRDELRLLADARPPRAAALVRPAAPLDFLPPRDPPDFPFIARPPERETGVITHSISISFPPRSLVRPRARELLPLRADFADPLEPRLLAALRLLLVE